MDDAWGCALVLFQSMCHARTREGGWMRAVDLVVVVGASALLWWLLYALLTRP